MFLKYLVLFALFTVAGQCFAQPPDSGIVPFEGQISLQSGVSAESLALGDTLVYSIRVQWSGPSENYVFWPPETPEAQMLNFSHMETVNQKRSTLDGYESSTVFKLYYVASEIGEASISSCEVKYLARGQKDFEFLRVQSRDLRVLPPARKFPWRDALWVLAIAAAAGAGLAFWLRQRKRRRDALSRTPEKTPCDLALERLAAAQARRLEGDAAGYYGALMEALQGGLETSALKPEPGQNSCQQAMEEKGLESGTAAEVLALLGTCRERKFSGYLPEAQEMDLFEARVRNAIRDFSRATASASK